MRCPLQHPQDLVPVDRLVRGVGEQLWKEGGLRQRVEELCDLSSSFRSCSLRMGQKNLTMLGSQPEA